MDASTHAVRDLLIDHVEYGPQRRTSERPLIERCGSDLPGQPAETYAALIGDHWFTPDRKVWDIEMTSSGEWLSVAIMDGDLPPVPPEPTPGVATPSLREIRQVSRHTVRKSALADVRDAWIEPSLWLAPQSAAHCLDGHIVYLEACVLGRYHARSRECGSEGREAATALWRRLRTHFPDPSPAELR
ncbi:MAG: hypothetical protein HOQ32_15280 [Lysobacter sp.]|nr:hypothetical protein [Lysobacter sp.]